MANFLQRSLGWLTRSYPSPQPMTWESLMGGHRASRAGISVNETSALNYSPVWAGVSTLSRDMAKLPLILHRRLPNGGKEPFVDHPLYRMLKDKWNPEMTSYKARETMMALCVLYRNAYAEIVRNDIGQPVGMYPITPWRVAPFRDDRSGQLRYRVTNHNGNQSVLLPANMLHISAMSLDGICGEPLMGHASESFGLGIASEQFGGAFFGSGMTFGGVLEVPGQLSAEAKTNIREQIEAVHAGVERAHKILVLAAGTKFTQRGTDPNAAQFTETREFQIREVARWLGMPPHKLADLKDAHHTNIEEENIDYYANTISGWAEMWEQELSSKLIAPLEYKQQTIKHTMEGVLRGNSAQRAEFYGKLFNVGAISVNRILELENMNPIGPAGDMHLVPLNMVPIERYNEMLDAQIAAKTAPKEIAPPAPKDDGEPMDERVAKVLAETRADLMAILEKSQTSSQDETRRLLEAASLSQLQVLEHAEKAAAALQAQSDAESRAEAAQSAQDDAQRALDALRAEKTTSDEALSLAQAALAAATQEHQVREAAAQQAGTESAARADQARVAHEEAQRALEAMTAAKTTADAALAEARTALERATSEHVEKESAAMQARLAAEASADAERLAREQAEQSLSAARSRLTAIEQELRTALDAREQADRQIQAHAERIAAVEHSAAETEARAADAASRATASEQERAEIRAQSEAVSGELTRLREGLQVAETQRTAAVRALEQAQSQLEVADHRIGDLEAFRKDELDRRGRMILAHRELMVDAVRRIARTEAERARKKGATPDSLRKHIEAFYTDIGRDQVADILYPGVLAHLTWARSEQAPRDVARSLAAEYQAQSAGQLRALADGMSGEEFQATLDVTLTRWVQERPDVVAMKVIHDDLSPLAQ